MIYVNEELVNTRNRTKETNPHYDLVEDYHDSIKKIREYHGDYLVVETKRRPYRDKKTGQHRVPAGRGLLLTSTVNRTLEDGSIITEELRYSPHILKKDEHGTLIHESPNMIIQRGSLTIDIKRNPDLAYYVWRCGKVGRTPAEGKKFHLYDITEINKESAKRRRLEGSVLHLIYSSLPEAKLRTLAKSFAVPEVSIKDLEAVRIDLFDKIQANEKRKQANPDSTFRGFADFIESAEVKYHDQIAALCSDAIEAEKVVYQEDERRWVIDYKDSGTPYLLKELSGDEFGDPLGTLVSYLTSEQNMLRKVEQVMGIGEKVKDVPVVTEEMILKESNVPKLKKLLKQLNPDVVLKQTMKGEEIKMMLLDFVKQESVQETQG